ncbi:MAG: hypothetical protein ABFD92_02335 [Planctomycetaceae bacterium]|nr:hypothetical protein [Planctomycetaceae bacterium]
MDYGLRIAATASFRTLTGATLFCCCGLFAALCGCSGDYPRKELKDDSPRAAQVKDMITQLRTAATNELDAVIAAQVVPAGPNDGGRREMAVYTLKQIANAPDVQIVMLDQYGSDVVRATLRLTESHQPRTLCMLLVSDGQGKLLWAGPG